jgi:hypothetical protein
MYGIEIQTIKSRLQEIPIEIQTNSIRQFLYNYRDKFLCVDKEDNI